MPPGLAAHRRRSAVRGGGLAAPRVLALRAVHGHRQVRALRDHDRRIAVGVPGRVRDRSSAACHNSRRRKSRYDPVVRPRAHRRRQQSAGTRRHRIHRVRDQQAAGARPGAGDDGLPPDRAPPLARGPAVPAGRHERDRQRRMSQVCRAPSSPSRNPPSPPSRCACGTRPPPIVMSSRPALGRFRPTSRSWSSTSRRSTASARAASTSSTATAISRSTTSTSRSSPRSIRTRPRWPACAGSASSSTSATTAWRTGPSFTASSSASGRFRTRSATAFFPRDAFSRVPTTAFSCSSSSPSPASSTSSPTNRCSGSASARPTCSKAVGALRERGVGFVESGGVHSDPRGALTQAYLGGVMFELVHDER